MKTKAIKAGFAISALALTVSPAMASEIRFDGFASFVMGQVFDKDELYNPTTQEYEAFRGFDERLDFQQNSLFALQARADLKDNLSATVQVVAKGSDDYDAKFNWAYLTYEINNELSVKLGRQRVPYFMYSDFLDVGYAYHWISPPFHVYNLGGFDSADGISLEHQTDIGNWISRISVMAGRANTELTSGDISSSVDVRNQLLAAWSMNYDWLTLRVTYAQSQMTIDLEDVVDGVFAGFQGATGIPLSDASRTHFLVDNDKGTFAGVGFAIDPGTFFIIGEATELALKDNLLQDPSLQWYLSAGYRMGQFTFYGTFEKIESDYNESGARQVYENDIAPLPIPDVVKAQLAEGINTLFNSSLNEEESYSIGVRYNFHPSAAVKFEFTQADNKVTGNEPQAIAVAVDLVY